MAEHLDTHEPTPAMAKPEVPQPIYVTRTFLPPREEYEHWLDQVYACHQLTNNGPIHKLLETALRERFDVAHLRLVANGTLALQLAIRALELKGDVITTPFSYVATTSAILWEGCTPVFVDIDPATCCIDPAKIEAAITPGTTAILATHVYGIPCDVEAIDAIAKKHGLKVIYDAAHAFDVQYKGRSILQWGDASTLSFHSTKLFHTVEGGAVVLKASEVDRRLFLQSKFGHLGDDHIMLGINAKMSEVHAAMGMAMLPHMEAIIAERRQLTKRLDEAFSKLPLRRPTVRPEVNHNYAYYPVITSSADQREDLEHRLEDRAIFGRRYFFPSLDTLPYVNGQTCPVSREIAGKVFCLPLFNGMTENILQRMIAGVQGTPEIGPT